RYSRLHPVRIPGSPLGSTVQKNLLLDPTCSSVQRRPAFTGRLLSPAPASSVRAALCEWSPVVFWDLSCVPKDYGEDNSTDMGTCQIRVPPPRRSAVSGHLLYYACSLWSSVVCPQSLGMSCTMSAVSGHLLYYVRSLWSSPVLCP
ncbi:unnamed protein product, partial [Staurois parvus]